MASAEAVPMHPVTKRLLDAGITSAVVIDDAYNSPAFDDLLAELPLFWAEVIRNAEALSELRGIAPGFEDDSDFNDELIKKLWAETLSGGLSKLEEPCKTTLFPRQVERLSELSSLVANLQGIGINPILMGTGDDLPSEQLKLFFLDFFLGPDPNQAAVEEAIDQLMQGRPTNPSIQASIDKAKQIMGEYDDPFIVLMSDKEGVQRARSRFRMETGLIEGMFDYAAKDELGRESDLHLRLGISAAGLPVRHDIQHFVNTLETSLKKASEEFILRVKSLSFEDYLYVYSLRLRTDAHPLGDYMSWLYRSLLGHLVMNHDGVVQARNNLDGIDMETYVPLKSAPSPDLAEIYRLSLTEPAPSSRPTHLRLGDLYVKGTEDVLLVINADCDLIHSPQSPSRPFPADMSILLHPGRLATVDKSHDSKFKVTELFVLDGQAYKIVWNHAGVITKTYDEVEKWLCCEGYSKKGRLIAPHALEIQQHFAASLTRVGMPVAPPFPRPATVRVFGKNEDGTLHQLGEDIARGVVIDNELFRFTVEGFKEILNRVGEGIRHYAALIEAPGTKPRRIGRLRRNVGKLEEMVEDRAEWFELIEASHGMPNQNGSQLGSKGIFQVFCRPDLESAEGLIVFNLILDEGLDEQNSSV